MTHFKLLNPQQDFNSPFDIFPTVEPHGCKLIRKSRAQFSSMHSQRLAQNVGGVLRDVLGHERLFANID